MHCRRVPPFPLDENGRFDARNLSTTRRFDVTLAFGDGHPEILLHPHFRLAPAEHAKADFPIGDVALLVGVVTDASGRQRACHLSD